MSKIYYCDKCKNTIEFKNGDNEICKCGYIFGTTTIEESIKKMGGK